MPNTHRNFVAGRMNKSLDERLVPNGEYIDALNVRLGSTEDHPIVTGKLFYPLVFTTDIH